MAKNTLQKINARAKAIRRAHPGKSWKAAQKQAGKEVARPKRVGVVRRKAKPGSVGKVRRKRVARTKRRVSGTPEQKYEIVHQLKPVSGISYKGGSIRLAGVGDVNRQKAQLKASLGQQAGWLDVAISSAKTKREKTALQKKRREIISELNRIK
jgi:hypothetical protein